MADLIAAVVGFALGVAATFAKDANTHLRQRPLIMKSLTQELLYSHKPSLVRALDNASPKYLSNDESLSVPRLSLKNEMFDIHKEVLYQRLGAPLATQVLGYYAMAARLSNKDVWQGPLAGHDAKQYLGDVATALSFLLATVDCLNGKKDHGKELREATEGIIRANWEEPDVSRDDALLKVYGKTGRP